MPVHGISGMLSPSHVCTLSTSHTDSPLSSLGKAAYDYWGYAAGLKIPRSQFFAPAEEAPLFYLRALLHQRLSPRHRSHVPRSHRYRPSASLLTVSPRNTHTTRSSGALFMRNHWKHGLHGTQFVDKFLHVSTRCTPPTCGGYTHRTPHTTQSVRTRERVPTRTFNFAGHRSGLCQSR